MLNTLLRARSCRTTASLAYDHPASLGDPCEQHVKYLNNRGLLDRNYH